MIRVLLTYLVVLLAWAAYRYFYMLSEPIDELVAKPLVFVLPVIWYAWQFEKGNWGKIWGDLGDRGNWGNIFKSLYLGLGLGMILGAEGLFFNFLKYGGFNFAPVAPVGSLPSTTLGAGFGLLGFLGVSAATAVSEEILGRGFLYGQLRYFLRGSRAVLLASLLFVLLHVPIVLFVLNLSGLTLGVYLFSVLVLSVANCLLFTYTGSLVAPILVHVFWNATVGLYL